MSVAKYTAKRTGRFSYSGAIAASGDPSFSSVGVLLHGDGANNGTTFTDSSSNGVTMGVSGAAVTSSSFFKFGIASMYFPVSSWIGATSANFTVGTGNFTIEFWVYPLSVANNGVFQISTTGFQSGTTNDLVLGIQGGVWLVHCANAGRGGASGVTANQWYHIALVRNSGATSLYVNGVLDTTLGSVTDTTNYTGGSLIVGGYWSSSFCLAGYVDDFRVTKGVARYTANFSVPTAAFPNY